MKPVTANPTIYPVYCHDISPTIGKWCPLRAADVHKLRSVGMVLDGRPLYHYGNHPVKWVRLTGVVVAIDDFYQRRVYTLDDSSGECMECTCEMPAPPPLLPAMLLMAPDQNRVTDKPQANVSKSEKAAITNANNGNRQKPKGVAEGIDVGSVVKIKGRVCEFRGMKQIEISSVVLMRGTEEEVRCWNESLEFRRDILSKPWVVELAKEEKMRKRSLGKKMVKRRVKDGLERDKSRKYGEVKAKGKDRQVPRIGLMTDGASEALEKKRKSHGVQRMSKDDESLPDKRQKNGVVNDKGRDMPMTGKSVMTGGPSEAPEKRRKSHNTERMTDEEKLLLGAKRQKDKGGTGLNPQNKANCYPSIALREKVAGKYDALGL